MQGSGYSEILIEAELVTTGCWLLCRDHWLLCRDDLRDSQRRISRSTTPMALLSLVQVCNRENFDLGFQDLSSVTIP